MSVQAMCWVLEHSRAEHSERLVLLSLANHAGTDGGDSYPSIPTIAREARLGESTVRAALERLKGLGELEEQEGLSPLGTRRFRLTMPADPAPGRNVSERPWQKPPPADSAPPPQILRATRNERRRRQELAPRAAGSAPEPSPEPSSEPSSLTPSRETTRAKESEGEGQVEFDPRKLVTFRQLP